MENEQYQQEVPVMEIILSIFRHWKTVVVCTVGVFLIGMIYSLFIITPDYSSSLNGTFTYSGTVKTIYGDYTLPSQNVADYVSAITSEDVLEKTIQSLNIGMTADELRGRISVSIANNNAFSFAVKDRSSQLSIDLVKKISEEYKNEIKAKYREYAVNALIGDFKLEIEKYAGDIQAEELKQAYYEKLLSSLSPVVTLKKLIVSNPELASVIAYENGLDISKLTDEVILYEEFINPIYTETELDIADVKATIQELDAKMQKNNMRYDELNKYAAEVKDYRKTGDISVLSDPSDSQLDAVSSGISFADSSISTIQVSPNKKLILIFSLLLGLLLGLIIVIIRFYWEKSGSVWKKLFKKQEITAK